MLRQVRFSISKYTKMLRGRGFAPDPTGGNYKITELPDPLAGFQGAASRQGRVKGGGVRREGGKGRG